MRKLIVLVLSVGLPVAVILTFGLRSLYDTPAKPVGPVSSASRPAPSPAPRSTPDYGARGLDNDWPELAQGAVALSDNLLRSNYYVVFDGSGSMEDVECSDGEPKISVAQRALTTFVDQIEMDANVGLLAFDAAGASERVELGTGNREQVKSAVASTQAKGGTPLSRAIQVAYQALTRQAVRQLGYGEYHLVVVTDGQASTGYDPDAAVDILLANSPVVLHTIGFCIEGNHSLNQGGRVVYLQANDPASLERGLSSVLAESPDFDVSSFDG